MKNSPLIRPGFSSELNSPVEFLKRAILLWYAESPGFGFHLMWGLSGLRMHICPSISKGMCVCVCVCVCVCPSENNTWFYHMPLTSSPSRPEGQHPRAYDLRFRQSRRKKKKKKKNLPPDNYLLSLTRREYNQVIAFTQNIPHALISASTSLRREWFFSLPVLTFPPAWYEERTPVDLLFWQTSSICAK